MKLISFLLLFYAIILPNALLACGEACNSDADCATSDCKECNLSGGPKVCTDCCENVDQASCDPGACYWNSSLQECENTESVQCNGVPEIPRHLQARVIIFLAAIAIAVPLIVRRLSRRRPQNKSDVL